MLVKANAISKKKWQADRAVERNSQLPPVCGCALALQIG